MKKPPLSLPKKTVKINEKKQPISMYVEKSVYTQIEQLWVDYQKQYVDSGKSLPKKSAFFLQLITEGLNSMKKKIKISDQNKP